MKYILTERDSDGKTQKIDMDVRCDGTISIPPGVCTVASMLVTLLGLLSLWDEYTEVEGT